MSKLRSAPSSPLGSCPFRVTQHTTPSLQPAGINDATAAMNVSALASFSTTLSFATASRCDFTGTVTGHGVKRLLLERRLTVPPHPPSSTEETRRASFLCSVL